MDSDSDRDEAITEARISGTSTRALAKRYPEMTSRDIEAAVDRRLDYELDDRMKLRSVKLDLARIERLFEFFFEMATKGERDVVAVSAGTLCCKLLERKALFTGTEAPLQSRVDVYAVEHERQPSSHEQIKRAIFAVARGDPTISRAIFLRSAMARARNRIHRRPKPELSQVGSALIV